MIVLRKLKTTSAGTNVLVSANLIGDKDGENSNEEAEGNKVFTTPDNFNPDNIYVTINGQKMKKDYDFEVTDSNEITFIYIAPMSWDVLTATYEIA